MPGELSPAVPEINVKVLSNALFVGNKICELGKLLSKVNVT